MADIVSNIPGVKHNDVEIGDDKPHTENLMTKIGANINGLIDRSNDHETRIGNAESTIVSHTSSLATQAGQISGLQSSKADASTRVNAAVNFSVDFNGPAEVEVLPGSFSTSGNRPVMFGFTGGSVNWGGANPPDEQYQVRLYVDSVYYGVLSSFNLDAVSGTFGFGLSFSPIWLKLAPGSHSYSLRIAGITNPTAFMSHTSPSTLTIHEVP